jgi:hypothetical protein
MSLLKGNWVSGTVTPAKAGVQKAQRDWIPLRPPVVRISLYNRPLRVVSLLKIPSLSRWSNHDFYPPFAD